MRTTYLMLAFIVILFSSCCKDYGSLGGIEVGKWFLVNTSGGLAGINQNYPKGEITWTFESAQLVIKNNYTGPWNVSLESNSFEYQTRNSIEGDELFLDDKYYTNISIKGDSMFLAEFQVADGFNFTLIR
jgi:hypothetical protein